jgi:hypothetical protein
MTVLAQPHEIVDEGALTVAMAIAPGVYARNRMFAFYKHPGVGRARARAATLRGMIRQLRGLHGEVCDFAFERGHGGAVVSYRIARLRLERQVELTDLEAACFAYLAARAGLAAVSAGVDDRALVEDALKRLAIDLRIG